MEEQVLAVVFGILSVVAVFFIARLVSILLRIPGRVKELERKVRNLENERLK